MKRIYIYLLSLLALVSCQNELYNDAQDEFQAKQGVYFVNKGTVQKFVEENKTVEIPDLSVGLTRKDNNPVKVIFNAGNQEQLDAYNKKNGTNYILLPESMYDLKKELVIDPLFTSVSVPLKLKDVQFSPKGSYALPIRIASSDVSVIGGQTDALVVLEQKIVTKILRMNGGYASDAEMFPKDFKVPAWTLEVMINRANYSSNNRAVVWTQRPAGSSALNEIFTRFGDVTIKPNQLQIKTGGSQIDIPADKYSALPNQWYMLSFVYDGKLTYVYINGILVAQREIRTGEYDVTGISIGDKNELIREVRFYKVARTPQQIAANIWKTIDYTDDNLLLYFPMNGKKYDHETGKIVEDDTMIWDWSKSAKHLKKPAQAIFDDNEGKGFVFPPETNS